MSINRRQTVSPGLVSAVALGRQSRSRLSVIGRRCRLTVSLAPCPLTVGRRYLPAVGDQGISSVGRPRLSVIGRRYRLAVGVGHVYCSSDARVPWLSVLTMSVAVGRPYLSAVGRSRCLAVCFPSSMSIGRRDASGGRCEKKQGTVYAFVL